MGSRVSAELLEAKAEAARILGKSRSEKKAAASRRNGKLGGRPKKQKGKVVHEPPGYQWNEPNFTTRSPK